MGIYERVSSNIKKVEDYHNADEIIKPFHLDIPETIIHLNHEAMDDPLHKEMMIMNSLFGLSNQKMSIHEAISLKHAAALDFMQKKEDFKDIFTTVHHRMKDSGSINAEDMVNLRKHWRGIESGLKPLINMEKIDMLDGTSGKKHDLSTMKLSLSILKAQEDCLTKLSGIVSKHKSHLYEEMKQEMKDNGFMDNNEWDVEAAIKRAKQPK